MGRARTTAIGLSAVAVLGLAAGSADAKSKAKRHLDQAAGMVTIFGSSTPGTRADSDTSSTELGVKFTSSRPGYVVGLRFYKGNGNTGTHTGALWSSRGMKLAGVTFTGETASGWQQATFSKAVPIPANTTYIASYHASRGRYADDGSYFAKPKVSSPLTASGSRYSYGAGSMFPTRTFASSNYYVDVMFSPSAPVSSPPPVTTPAPTPTPVTPAPTPTPAPPAQLAPPSASFGYSPTAPTTGSEVSFSAAASTCDAAPCTYSWQDVGADGSGGWDLGSGQTLKFTFQNAGTKFVQLTVTDAQNRTDSATQAVQVSAPRTPAPPSSTPTPTPPSSTPTPAPPSATPTPTPAPPTSTPSGGFPNPSTAGLPAGWTPTKVYNGSYTVTTAGAVVQDIQVNGDLNVAAPNVTLRRVDVKGGSIENRPGGMNCQNGLVVEDSTIEPGSSPDTTDFPAIDTGGYTARRVKIWNRGEGFRVGGKSDGGCGPVNISDSFVKVMTSGVCDDVHSDGLQGYDGNALTISNTTIDFNTSGPCEGAGTSPFFYVDNAGNTSATINGLLVMGGGINFRDKMPGSVTNLNVVDKSWYYGPLDVTCSPFSHWDAKTVNIDSNYNITKVVANLPCQ